MAGSLWLVPAGGCEGKDLFEASLLGLYMFIFSCVFSHGAEYVYVCICPNFSFYEDTSHWIRPTLETSS